MSSEASDFHLLRPAQAAPFVGSRNKLDELARSGQLRFVLVGHERRFRLGDLIEWQDARRSNSEGVVYGPAATRELTTKEMKAVFARCK